jgi:Protein of unknown function (DUF1571)
MDTAVKQRELGARRLGTVGALALLVAAIAGAAAGEASELELSTLYYSTAAPPRDYPGPGPIELALLTPDAADPQPNDRAQPAPVAPATEPPAAPSPAREGPTPEVASVPRSIDPSALPKSRARAVPQPATTEASVAAETDPIAFAKQSIADCRARYIHVQDYTCTFYKRERITGRLSDYHIMAMKARARPLSIYFKFQQPNAGREAIYVAGQHGGHILAHDVGIGKLVAGTLVLDPHGSRAMEGCLHPVTDAGIGNLIDTVYERWNAEMKPGETQVAVHLNAHVGARACTLIESTHPQRNPRYLFYRAKVYIDHEHGLPIRFEAYDWPRRPGAAPELVEEYTYLNLLLNPGLSERDFDPANKQYSFGRF